MTEKRIFKIVEIAKETPDVWTFHLIPKDGEKFEFKLGQFVNLHLDSAFRPYSVASCPKRERIDLTVKMVKGKLTSKLENLKVGNEVEISGPFGNFAFDDASELVMIACGIGITPMISHLREIADKKLNKKVILFYSEKTGKDILFGNELNTIQRDNPSVRIIYVITREKSADACECRRIDSAMIAKYVENPSAKKYLVCGPSDLAGNISEILDKLGVPRENIKIECWG